MSRSELDELLDHDYDGIREYDNPMPGWWVGIFWATCIFSVGYYMFYQVGDSPSLLVEYDREALAFYEEQAKRYEGVAVTQEVIHGFMLDEKLLRGAAQLYQARCVSCHRNDGGGNIGPNLTDNFWLHGGELTDIYKTISEGVPAKGMQSWKKALNPAQMMYLAAYIASLEGTNPPLPKEPQGDPWKPFSERLGAAPPAQPAPAPAPAATPAAGKK